MAIDDCCRRRFNFAAIVAVFLVTLRRGNCAAHANLHADDARATANFAAQPTRIAAAVRRPRLLSSKLCVVELQKTKLDDRNRAS